MKIATATAVACLSIGLAAADDAQAVMRHYELNIPKQSLNTALRDFAQQTGLRIALFSDTIDGNAVVGPIVGNQSAEDALKTMLAPSGLSYKVVREGTIAVLNPKDAPAGAPVEDKNKKPFWNRFTISQTVTSDSNRETAAENSKVPSPSSEEGGEAKLEEIVVTAQKREERLQDVPMSIAVLSNQDIERRGVIGMQDYLRSVPGVSQIDRGSADNAIVIRGITTTPQSENVTSGTTVATYFDETPITGAAGIAFGGVDVRPVDLERIEILRGPQGTAFGAASLGGAVRIIPAKPDLEAFSAKLGTAYSETSGSGGDNTMVQGVVNVPLAAGRFAVRAVGYRYDESGYYRNVAGDNTAAMARAANAGVPNYGKGFVQDDIGRMISTGGRLSALWQITPAVSLTLGHLTQTLEQNGSPIASVGEFEQAVLPIAPQGRVNDKAGEFARTKMHLSNLLLKYDMGWGTLTTAGSWIDANSIQTRDLWEVLPTVPASNTIGPSEFKAFTAETRVTSALEGRTQFLAGLYYENVDEDYRATIDWPGAPAPSPIFVTNPISYVQLPRDREQRAVFGEISYEFIKQLTGTVGARYFEYDRSARELREGGANGVPLGAGIAPILKSSESDSSYKANLSYQPREDALLYASWSQGFRLGRPSAGLPTALCDVDGNGIVDGTSVTIASTRTINSDFLDNYELGGKLRFFDRRASIDAAVYHIKWEGLPIYSSVPSCRSGYVANAGAATSDGVEFQASVLVTDGLKLDFGGSYTKAELSQDAPGLGARKGARLPGSPKINGNFAAQYDFVLGGNAAFVRADSMYIGKFHSDLLASPGTVAGNYVKIDARVGLAIRKITLELFGRNLTNEDAFTWRTLTSTNTNPFNGYRLQPRTVGIQLGYAFD